MTICIGVICGQGSSVILAADTMLTNNAIPIQFEHPGRKMTRLADKCVALTAGDALAYTELFNMVYAQVAALKSPLVEEVVERIKECYQKIRAQRIRESILMPRGFDSFEQFINAQKFITPDLAISIQLEIDRYDYGLQILIAGVNNNIAHIYEIYDPGTSRCFDAVGFHAIGSGQPHAINTLIARNCHQETSVEEALVIVYEAKKMAEKAPGVGADITDICIMRPTGVIDIPRGKIAEIQAIYDKWVSKEETWRDEIVEFLKKIEEG